MCSIASRNLLNAGRFFYKSPSAYTCKVLSYSFTHPRRLLSTGKLNTPEDDNLSLDKTHKTPTPLEPGYREFRDEDSQMILDVEEEMKKLDLESINTIQEMPDPYEGFNMKRGEEGVFDIEDLVELLRKDKAQNIFVTKVPKELGYVDYLVVVTGRSPRHMTALATFVRKAYKLKRHETDLIPKIEGAKSNDWMALDLGNIALHIFSNSARAVYDLETLWSVGSTYDNEFNKPDPEKEFQDRYKELLAGLEPADEEIKADGNKTWLPSSS